MKLKAMTMNSQKDKSGPTDESEKQVNQESISNEALAKKLYPVAWVLTVAVLFLVGLMRQVKLDIGLTLDFLPPVHAILNSTVAILLVVAIIMIKQGRITAHKNAITAAMVCSALFLLCYVAYHFTTPETKFGGEGVMRTVYFALLISHIALAAISFPLILFTWIFGFTRQDQRHRKFSKITFPMWLYVAVTGPICYLMLRPYY
jgi:putative membrane protein